MFLVGTLGDTLVSIPALRVVRGHYNSGYRITLMHETHDGISYGPQDVLKQQELVDDVVSYRCPITRCQRLLTGIRTASRLRALKCDVVIYLIGGAYRTRIRVARDKIFFGLGGARRFHCFHPLDTNTAYPRDEAGRPKPVKQEAEYLLGLLSRAGFDTSSEIGLRVPNLKVPEENEREAEEWLRANKWTAGRDFIGICPGSKKQVCRWPVERFEELARRVVEKYRVGVVLVGGPGESEFGARVARAAGAGLNACGALSVLGSAALLRRCKCMVGLDTGTAHLAAAVGTRCVLLFSAHNWPGRWEPLGSAHIVIRRLVPCEGCRRVQCNVLGHPCMTGISVDAAWREVEAVCAEERCARAWDSVVRRD